MMELYDIAIIGGGPVGMFAAFYAGLRDTKAVLVESLPTLGGQVTALYPEKVILDVAGFVGIKGSELIDSLYRQLQLFPVEIKTNTTVTNLQKQNDLFTITTDNGTSFQAKTVIVTTGKGSFEPRKIQVDGADSLVGQGIHYFVTNKQDFMHHDVAIAGGGDSAVDMATMLNDVTASTRIIHRRDTFRAMEQSVNALNSSTVIKETPKKIVSINKQGNGKLAVTLALVKDPYDVTVISVDDLIINYGFISKNQTVASWDIKPVQDNQVFAVNQQLQTSIEGVFAIGDASHYLGKADLIAVGLGEAPNAINAAVNLFDPKRGGPGHSSSMVIKNGHLS
ncbi:MAG: NAD(P)/FAD-dependent oxidoreductase [Leuconostoc gelidum]|uniref:NAD(P)/FAD-dependent oxidoreductase n=1 Tax=Leuconostoc gelidum TaxID=1244 RepID=UPI0015750EB4|nr:NAD(P)/FAD-dependent oxidoreductase [Leuconostoc gelidum]MBZ5979024.1 NAD(P)/FAD-dependent oxidoreductase [Leuconostoc gelidum subsp. gelidum]MBZ6000694.1 NAD(P)/FAD-dependent oxidoreductase [Leuconostoc gelidum subsp. gelidum]